MTPQELYRSGKLREAITVLGEELKSNPLDTRRRMFLFELLLFAGEYDRAEKQLDVIAGTGRGAAVSILLHRSALHAERTRQEMFSKGQTPSVVDQSPIGGVCDGHSFCEFSDTDPRIGQNLEVYIAGSYTWIPFSYLRKVEIEPPITLRDLMWLRARIEITPEFRLRDLGEVFIPAISPLSSRHRAESVQLGREAAWEKDSVYDALPFGAKIMSVDGKDVPLLNIRSVKWRSESEEPDHASA